MNGPIREWDPENYEENVIQACEEHARLNCHQQRYKGIRQTVVFLENDKAAEALCAASLASGLQNLCCWQITHLFGGRRHFSHGQSCLSSAAEKHGIAPDVYHPDVVWAIGRASGEALKASSAGPQVLAELESGEGDNCENEWCLS